MRSRCSLGSSRGHSAACRLSFCVRCGVQQDFTEETHVVKAIGSHDDIVVQLQGRQFRSYTTIQVDGGG